MLGSTRKADVLLCLVLLLTAFLNAHADHVPGHDDCDPMFPVPLPDQSAYNGGIAFVTAIGPLAEDQILQTTFDIKYVSDGATPARDLLLNVQVAVNDELRELEITGADMGFGEGAGNFRAHFTTNFVNGEVWNNSPGPQSIVEIGIGAVDGGVEGTAYFVGSKITFSLGLRVDGTSPTTLHYSSPFDVATGLLSDLHATGQYFSAECLGSFEDSRGIDPLLQPSPGDGRYYLARNLGRCAAQGYGNSSIAPDPRDWLDANSPCP